MERDGLAGMIGDDHFFDWNQHALEHLWSQMASDKRENSPLYSANPREIDPNAAPD